MDFLKELFGSEALTFDQLSAKVTEKGFKIADLSTGNYVAKKKYTDDVESKDTQIADLLGQIKTRDTDLATVKKQLSDGTTTNEDLTSQLTKLQGEYKTAKTEYETKLSRQAYEFGVKELANNQSWSSPAARRDFEREMLSANLQMKDNTILGANDFLEAYKLQNAESFKVVEQLPQGNNEPPKPTFVQPTPPQVNTNTNAFDGLFNFGSVR